MTGNDKNLGWREWNTRNECDIVDRLKIFTDDDEMTNSREKYWEYMIEKMCLEEHYPWQIAL